MNKFLKSFLMSVVFILFTACGSGGNPESEVITSPAIIVESLVVPTLRNSSVSIVENAIVGTSLGRILINDHGDSSITSIVLDGIGSENFSVDVNGTIMLQVEEALDYETKSTYNLTAVATNDAGSSTPASLLITVIDVNEITLNASDFSMTLDVSSSTIMSNWQINSSVSDSEGSTFIAQIKKQGNYGTFVVTDN